MSSGSYFPPPVRAVEIPKPHGGGVRMLGVPTIADRVAQTVVAMHLEPRVEPQVPPGLLWLPAGQVGPPRDRGMPAAVLEVRLGDRSRRPEVLRRGAVGPRGQGGARRSPTAAGCCCMSSGGWLPRSQHPDGALEQRTKGTPQGSAVSPILANLFMHYAFDSWMARNFPGCPFERYADDGVPRTLKEDRCRRRFRRMRCCTRDGGWPSAVALQGEIANHREVRRSRAGVLSVAEKARHQRVRCGSRRRAKANHR